MKWFKEAQTLREEVFLNPGLIFKMDETVRTEEYSPSSPFAPESYTISHEKGEEESPEYSPSSPFAPPSSSRIQKSKHSKRKYDPSSPNASEEEETISEEEELGNAPAYHPSSPRYEASSWEEDRMSEGLISNDDLIQAIRKSDTAEMEALWNTSQAFQQPMVDRFPRRTRLVQLAVQEEKRQKKEEEEERQEEEEEEEERQEEKQENPALEGDVTFEEEEHKYKFKKPNLKNVKEIVSVSKLLEYSKTMARKTESGVDVDNVVKAMDGISERGPSEYVVARLQDAISDLFNDDRYPETSYAEWLKNCEEGRQWVSKMVVGIVKSYLSYPPAQCDVVDFLSNEVLMLVHRVDPNEYPCDLKEAVEKEVKILANLVRGRLNPGASKDFFDFFDDHYGILDRKEWTNCAMHDGTKLGAYLEKKVNVLYERPNPNVRLLREIEDYYQAHDFLHGANGIKIRVKKDMGWEIEMEKLLGEEEYMVCGKMDLVLYDNEEKEWTIYDFKRTMLVVKNEMWLGPDYPKKKDQNRQETFPPSSDFIKYAVQQSGYRFLFQKWLDKHRPGDTVNERIMLPVFCPLQHSFELVPIDLENQVQTKHKKKYQEWARNQWDGKSIMSFVETLFELRKQDVMSAEKN